MTSNIFLLDFFCTFVYSIKKLAVSQTFFYFTSKQAQAILHGKITAFVNVYVVILIYTNKNRTEIMCAIALIE